jgi:Putative Flp pilus-assembly TadE/G-like
MKISSRVCAAARVAISTAARTREEPGQTLPLIVVFMVVLMAFAGLVIDLGNAYRVQVALQASTDASAAAGAGMLTEAYPPNVSNAVTRAEHYGSETGGINTIGGLPSASVTQTVSTSCTITVDNLPCTNANTVTVKQSAQVPTYFLSVLGVNSIGITTSAQACSPCSEIPLDIMLVIDRTGSMSESGGSTNGLNKEQNLQQGLLQGFLPGLDPTQDQVGMSVLPPDSTTGSDFCDANSDGQQNASYTVGSGRSAQTYTTAYGYTLANPVYDVISPMEYSYMNPATMTLNSGDPLVSDINCMSPGGSTEYADALSAASTELQNDGRPGVQKVIVLLSDGAANTGQDCKVNYATADCTQPCQAGVNVASTLKSAPDDVLIYTILYGDSSDYGDCDSYNGNNESPSITPQTAMSEMASPNDYYSDPNPASLSTIFQEIAASMAAGSSRIIS